MDLFEPRWMLRGSYRLGWAGIWANGDIASYNGVLRAGQHAIASIVHLPLLRLSERFNRCLASVPHAHQDSPVPHPRFAPV